MNRNSPWIKALGQMGVCLVAPTRHHARVMWHGGLIGTIFPFVMGRLHSPLIRFRARSLLVFAFLVSCAPAPLAQVLQYKKPTEQLIKRYKRMVAEGALLSPDGWARAS